MLANSVVIVTPAEAMRLFEDTVSQWLPSLHCMFADGGSERQISVSNGLAALDDDTDIVVVHDAARPFVTGAAVTDSIAAAAQWGAATVAIPTIDTILVADAEECLDTTPDRDRLWACQTPQTFRVGILHDAHRYAAQHKILGTDDASLVRHMGRPVKLVRGSYLNFKITTPSDVAFAECVIERGLV